MFPCRRKILFISALIGVLLRIILTLAAGNQVLTPWRVGGDAEFYVRLASTLAQGMGFTYAHQPTAFRPPLYPLFLAGMMEVFGTYYAAGTRFIQCAVGLATVWFCWRTVGRIFGEHESWSTLLMALYFPSLVIFSTELMTECFATFLTAALFWLVLDNPHIMDRRTAICLGLVVGIATLLRFNMAILGLVPAWVFIRSAGLGRALPNLGVLAMVSGLIVSPWVVRNEIVFHGQVLFSTQGGYNALQGVLTPQGRAQAGDRGILRAAGAWLSSDLESNGSQRLKLSSEPELDRQAWDLARRIWWQKAWHVFPLIISKLGYFWLSTDQLFSTHSFPWKIRAARAAGVMLYWCLLALAITGWVQLHQTRPDTAKFLLGYALLISLSHLPFIMTGRHRIPFFEPLLLILGGAGWTELWKRWNKRWIST